MKIKNLKVQPLLQPPGEDDVAWRRITASDRKAMEDAYRGYRREGKRWEASLMSAKMHRLGLQETLDPIDRYELEAHLNMNRMLNNGYGIAMTLYYLKEWGIMPKLTKEDLSLMKRDLMAQDPNQKTNLVFAKQLYWMRQIGAYGKITPEDGEKVRKELSVWRGTFMGAYVAELHHQMKALGMEEPVTDSDVEDIRRALEADRRDRHGDSILEIHYWMRDILPPPKPTQAPQIPPIKGFRK